MVLCRRRAPSAIKQIRDEIREGIQRNLHVHGVRSSPSRNLDRRELRIIKNHCIPFFPDMPYERKEQWLPELVGGNTQVLLIINISEHPFRRRERKQHKKFGKRKVMLPYCNGLRAILK